MCSYDIVLLYSIGFIYTIPTCQTLITLITLIIESFLSSEQIKLTLSVHRPYLLTYSFDVVLLYSLGCIHPIATCQTLITLITLVTESFVTICTDNVNGPLVALNWNTPLPVSGGYFLVGPRTLSLNQSRPRRPPRRPPRRILPWPLSGKCNYLSTNVILGQIPRIQ